MHVQNSVFASRFSHRSIHIKILGVVSISSCSPGSFVCHKHRCVGVECQKHRCCTVPISPTRWLAVTQGIGILLVITFIIPLICDYRLMWVRARSLARSLPPSQNKATMHVYLERDNLQSRQTYDPRAR